MAPFSLHKTTLPHFLPSRTLPNAASNSTTNSIQSTNRRLNCMLQFLDRKLSAADHHDHRRNSPSGSVSMPEFVAKGGCTDIFKPPARAAVHPSRPLNLKLRLHPLRETQIRCFMRNIVATKLQLWAASECGLRFWNFKDLYAPWCGDGGEGVARSGKEESASFLESVWTSHALCLVVDEANMLVWSGYKGRKIRCWAGI